MTARFKIYPARSLFVIVVFLLLSSLCFAQTPSPAPAKGVFGFLSDHWAIIALTVSEILPFLGQKAGGIVQAVFTVLGSIFKKK